MSEIERAIEYFEQKIIKNDRACENYVAPFAEEAKRQWIEIDRPIGELALKLLRAELEREKNPLTWNERINQMTVEEKAVFFSELFNCAACPIIDECQHDCNTMLTKWLNSPYTEGANK